MAWCEDQDSGDNKKRNTHTNNTVHPELKKIRNIMLVGLTNIDTLRRTAEREKCPWSTNPKESDVQRQSDN